MNTAPRQQFQKAPLLANNARNGAPRSFMNMRTGHRRKQVPVLRKMTCGWEVIAGCPISRASFAREVGTLTRTNLCPSQLLGFLLYSARKFLFMGVQFL